MTSANAPDLVDEIRQQVPSLSSSMRKVAAWVLADPAEAETISAAELARRAGTSQPTVTRFCQALGFKSYSAFQLTLARERGRASQPRSEWIEESFGSRIQPGDDLELVVSLITAADVRSLQVTARAMDLDALDQASHAITRARQTHLLGVGGSAMAALEAELRLMRIGCPARAWRDVHEAATAATLATKDDVAIAFSYSGETREVYEPLQILRERGATTVAVTHTPGSSIAQLADIELRVTDAPISFREGAFASRHAFLQVVDFLYVRVAQLTFDQSTASLAATSGIRDMFSVKRSRNGGRAATTPPPPPA